MTTISPLMDVALSHNPHVTAGADSGHVVAISWEGNGSLISPGFQTVKTFTVSEQPEGAALSSDGSLLAVAAADGITLLSTLTFEKAHHLDGASLGCLFVGEKLFWTCTRLTGETVLLEAREPGSWATIARAEIEDPYGASSFSILPHPDRNSVIVWAAGGQDGQCIFWATLEGAGIEVTHFEDLDETGLPSISPNGDEFLVTTEGALHRYQYPGGPLKGSLEELEGDEDEEDSIGYFVSYLDAGHALLTTANGRLLLLDVEEMSVIGEVVIPNLGTAHSLEYLLPMTPGKVVVVYRRRGKGTEKTSHLYLLGRREG